MSIVLAAAVLCVSPRVHDGDTLRCGDEKVRIANIDAPELSNSPPCHDRRRYRYWCDYAAGVASRDALIQLIGQGRVTFDRQGVDRYGRTLARVQVNGVDAGEWLVAQGLARRWR